MKTASNIEIAGNGKAFACAKVPVSWVMDGVAGESVILAHVAAEDLHGGDAEAQGEERLVHGGGDDGAKARLLCSLEIGQQVELHALGGAGQQEAVDRQHLHEG